MRATNAALRKRAKLANDPLSTRVLVVDDEESIQQTLSVVLPTAGYGVYPVRNGREALPSIQSVRPDLILLDLGLPDMDGKQVIKHLREKKSTPIIVISVRHEESEKVICLDTGANDYLVKPFTIGKLLARMRAALRRVSATQSAEAIPIAMRCSFRMGARVLLQDLPEGIRAVMLSTSPESSAALTNTETYAA